MRLSRESSVVSKSYRNRVQRYRAVPPTWKNFSQNDETLDRNREQRHRALPPTWENYPHNDDIHRRLED